MSSGGGLKDRASRIRQSRGEDDCQDVTCKETKDVFKRFMQNESDKARAECPLDRETLGKYTWSLLHTIASKYPTKPTDEQKNDMKNFIRIFGNLYPCSYCAEEFRADMSNMPPQLESRQALADWFCRIHNKTNERLGKPQYDCSKLDERWRTGWKDGSCM